MIKTLDQIREAVNRYFGPQNIRVQFFDCGSEIHFETNQKDKSMEGMQVIYDKTTGIFEVSEYMAGPKQQNLYIYGEFKQIGAAIRCLVKGNNRKPIKIW